MVISRCKRDHALCTTSVLRDYVRIATVISRNKKINLYDTNNSKFFFFSFYISACIPLLRCSQQSSPLPKEI